mmetsp:Transcript_1396/g.4899  ORF Transcript_1396/g.4899 Transcript_1396/m.4899 type:complete len:355 (-) Transcript_1396:2277-3341(-)
MHSRALLLSSAELRPPLCRPAPLAATRAATASPTSSSTTPRIASSASAVFSVSRLAARAPAAWAWSRDRSRGTEATRCLTTSLALGFSTEKWTLLTRCEKTWCRPARVSGSPLFCSSLANNLEDRETKSFCLHRSFAVQPQVSTRASCSVEITAEKVLPSDRACPLFSGSHSTENISSSTASVALCFLMARALAIQARAVSPEDTPSPDSHDLTWLSRTSVTSGTTISSTCEEPRPLTRPARATEISPAATSVPAPSAPPSRACRTSSASPCGSGTPRGVRTAAATRCLASPATSDAGFKLSSGASSSAAAAAAAAGLEVEISPTTKASSPDASSPTASAAYSALISSVHSIVV